LKPDTHPYYEAVCTDNSPAAQIPVLQHDFEPNVEIELYSADSMAVITLVDSCTDNLMPDQRPARRAGPRP
jgi:hypothetical protein